MKLHIACVAALCFSGMATAGEVESYCLSAVDISLIDGLDNENELATFCACLEQEIPEEDHQIYLEVESVEDWEDKATDAMKAAGASCLPPEETE